MDNQPPRESLIQKLKPYIAVIFLQVSYAIMNIITKMAFEKGMSSYVFVVYRHAVAFMVMTPFSLYYERNMAPAMSWSVFGKILGLSILEPVVDQNLFFLGMKLTTATFSAAMTNIIPAITFLLACLLRFEILNFRNRQSQAKVLGTATTLVGAMMMTFVKGPTLIGVDSTIQNTDHHTSINILGAVFIVLGCVSAALFVTLQAIILQAYPKPLSLSSLICLFGTMIDALVACLFHRRYAYLDWSIFKPDMKLLSAVYAGIFCSGLAFYLQGVIIRRKGPVFATIFSPCGMVIVAVISICRHMESLVLGRLIGSIVICLGLYMVLWDRTKKPIEDVERGEEVEEENEEDVERDEEIEEEHADD